MKINKPTIVFDIETTGLDIRAAGFPSQIVDDEPEEIGYEVTV